MAQTVKRLPAMREAWVQSLGREDPLEKEMATHSSILAWKILWSEEPAVYSPSGCKESDMTLTHTQVERRLESRPLGKGRGVEPSWCGHSGGKESETNVESCPTKIYFNL